MKRFGNERKEVDPPTTCLPRNEYLSLTTKRECIKRNLEKHVQMAFQGDWCDHLNRMLTFYHWEETHRYSILPYAKERHYPLKTSKATSLKAFYFSMKSFLITNPLPLWGCTVDPNLWDDCTFPLLSLNKESPFTFFQSLTSLLMDLIPWRPVTRNVR